MQFPEGSGGLGLARVSSRGSGQGFAAANAPFPSGKNLIGLGMVAPTVVAHGTETQKARYLRPLFTCEELWCQLFSEPGAGSDVASLATRAVATVTSGS